MNREVFGFIVQVLSLLALPAVLIWAYEKWVARPKRVPDVNGDLPPPPAYVRIADWILPFTLLAVVLRLGVGEVFAWAKVVAEPLSWLAVPIGLLCAVDSWIFAPRRQLRAVGNENPDPLVLRAAYTVLPVLVIAVIVRMISAETLDFSLVLLLLSVATGLVWAIDTLVFKKKREQAAKQVAGSTEAAVTEPGTVDYARSFFPVAFIVLLVRAFIFEPFRIPSDSMMPTLLDGDFIVVNKYAYGLRWPVLNQKFVDTGAPQRGDVVVFRYPPKPSVNYIKRLVGLPGDRVEVRDDHLVINGETIAQTDLSRFTDGCYVGMRLSSETLGEHTHQVLSCRSPSRLYPSRGMFSQGEAPQAPVCDRKKIREDYGSWYCNEVEGPRDAGDQDLGVVPPGHYLMIGDNRDNSEDGRVWGFVPDENLVGKATRIWFNLDVQRSNMINWGRIGDGIQ